MAAWRRGARRQLQADISAWSQQTARASAQAAEEAWRRQKADARAGWRRLSDGDPTAVTTALEQGLDAQPWRATVVQAGGTDAALVLHVPTEDVVPPVEPFVTPGGRLSGRAWTQTKRNVVYAEAIAAHLLATFRLAWAVAPSLAEVRIVGVRCDQLGPGVVFDVEAARASTGWDRDDHGTAILADPRRGLHRSGRTRQVVTWAAADLDDELTTLLAER